MSETSSARFTRPPIIIGGSPRSGTTLLLSILSAHPRIFAIPEESWAFWPTHTAAEFNALLEDFERRLAEYEVPETCTSWCEKTPNNVKVFDRFLECRAPDIRILHIVRDGRDVVTSRHPHDPSKPWVSPESWIYDVSLGSKVLDHPQVHTVRYEDLVESFESTVQRICEFLEEKCCEEILNWHSAATVRINYSWEGEVRPIFRSSIGRWKNPEFAPLVKDLLNDPTARQLLETFGYL